MAPAKPLLAAEAPTLWPSPADSCLPVCPRRALHLAATRPTCTTSSYQLFPPPFRRACRALLLAAHRSSAVHQGVTDVCHSAGVQPPAHLGSLPADVLLLVMQHAAYPLSLWVGVDDAVWVARRTKAIHCLEEARRLNISSRGAATRPDPPEAPIAPAALVRPLVAAAAARGGSVGQAAAAAVHSAPPQPATEQPSGVAAEAADALAAFSAAVSGGPPATGIGGAAAVAGSTALGSSGDGEVPAVPTPEQLTDGLAMTDGLASFSSHAGPFVFGANG